LRTSREQQAFIGYAALHNPYFRDGWCATAEKKPNWWAGLHRERPNPPHRVSGQHVANTGVKTDQVRNGSRLCEKSV